MKKLTLNTGSGAIELIDRRALRTVVSGVQVIDLNATDKCTVKVRSAEPFDIPIGATCTIFGRFYRMNYLPRVEKIEDRLFEIDIELEGVQYDLIRAIYDLTIDTTSNQLQDVRGEALTGDLNRFATVLIANANRIFPGGWRLGECPTTAKDITLTFGETDNCLLVLQRLCQEFKTEFDVSIDNGVFVLNLRKVGRVLPFRFEFGKGKGVYRLERQNVSQSNIITRLKVQGASKNLTSKYRSSRLCLPGKSKNLSFVEDPAKVEKYGLFETRKFFDDIYPTRTGKVTGIRAGDVLQFSDDTMFDLNERDDSGATKYLLPGTAAKIHFNSGNLAGYEFDIVSYDHTTHTFKIKAITDERNETFPSGKSTAFQFSVGDEYKLLQITLPQSYIDDAERRLKEEAEKLYAQKSQPEVTYRLTLEELFIRKLYGQASGTILNVGDYVQVKDDDLMVDKSLRIAGFTRDLINEYKYNLTISEAPVSSSLISKIVEGLAEIDRVLTINDLRNTARSRRNWRDTQELLNLIFDPDGYFLADKIKPLSIETSMLSVGAKSAQLMLNGVVIEPNTGGNANHVSVTSGTLDHLTLSDSIRSWSIHGGATVINDDEAHYIYARCAKDGNAGTIAFDKSKLKPEDEAGYYNFLIGVLHGVRDNVRGISLTYGSSTINGRFITTGVIQSENGQSFFDLDNNSFRIGDNRSGLSWNLNGDRTLRLKGGTIVQSQGGDEDFLPYDRGAWTNGMTVYPYDIVSYNGYRWLWRGADPTTSMPGTSGEWEKKGEVPQSPYSVTLSSYERVIKEGGEGLRQELKVVTGDKQVTTQGKEVVTSQYSLSTHITVLRGSKELLYSATAEEGAYTATLRAQGLSASVNAGNIVVTSVGDKGGHVDIEVNCEGKTIITKRFSVVVVKDGVGKYTELRYMHSDTMPDTPTGRHPKGWSKSNRSPRETVEIVEVRSFEQQGDSYVLDLINTDQGSISHMTDEDEQYVTYRVEGQDHSGEGVYLRLFDLYTAKTIYDRHLYGSFDEKLRLHIPQEGRIVLSVRGRRKASHEQTYTSVRLTRADSSVCWETRAEITPSLHDIEGATVVPTWTAPTIYKAITKRTRLTPSHVLSKLTSVGGYSPSSYTVAHTDDDNNLVRTSMVLYTSSDGLSWARKEVHKDVSTMTVRVGADATYYKVRTYDWVDGNTSYTSGYLHESNGVVIGDGRDGANGKDGADGKAPRISPDGYWEYWDGSKWVKTDIKAQGADGRVGAMPVPTGAYKQGRQYFYNDEVRHIVLYRASGDDRAYPYVVKNYSNSAVNVPPTGRSDDPYWKRFNFFEMVATDLLLADGAYLAEFIFKEGKLISQRGLFEGREVNMSDVPAGKLGAFMPNVELDGRIGGITIRGSVATPFVWDYSGDAKVKETIIISRDSYNRFNNVGLTFYAHENGKTIHIKNVHDKTVKLHLRMYLQALARDPSKGSEIVEVSIPPGAMLSGIIAPDVRTLQEYPNGVYQEIINGVLTNVGYIVGIHPITPMQETETTTSGYRKFTVGYTVKGAKEIKIVAAGRVDDRGSTQQKLGAFDKVDRYGTGRYRVHHNIGHSNYVPTVTTQGSGTLVAMLKNTTSTYFDVEISDDAGRYDNGGFAFQCVAEA